MKLAHPRNAIPNSRHSAMETGSISSRLTVSPSYRAKPKLPGGVTAIKSSVTLAAERINANSGSSVKYQ